MTTKLSPELPKKVTAFVGSARKKHTHEAVTRFLSNLQALGGVESEIVAISDYRLEPCRGCCVCFLKGEESCPLKDDRDVLIAKMDASDGVVFASPNYAFQVSALMKCLLDRLSFVLHRPRFFGKVSTSIVVQAVFGGGKVVKYLDFAGWGLGFNVVQGSCSTGFDPMSPAERRKMETTLASHSRRFHARLMQPGLQTPSLVELMAFRMARTSMKVLLGDDSRDHTYYRDRGWFESDYYYPTRLGPLKKAAGAAFDWVADRQFRPKVES